MGRPGAFILALAVAAGGCRGDRPEAEAAAATAEAGESGAAADQDMLSRRDALLVARRSLSEQRESLRQRREQVAASGGDTSAIDQEVKALLQRERKLVVDEQNLNEQLSELLELRRASVAAGSDDSARVAAREAAMAVREKTLARREQDVAQRESRLADREEKLATKWKDSCAAAPATTTIVQTVAAPKGAKYSKKDVESLLSRARRSMSKKGILRGDLPPPARDLEREATRAMASGDFGQARFAAAQLAGTVRSLQVNKAFVSAKWARLNRVMKGKKLSSEQETLLSGAAGSIADGKFGSANRKLNSLFASAR